MKCFVLGSGGWGTALAMLLQEQNNRVTLWSHTAQESQQLRDTLENPLLPGVALPGELRYTADLSDLPTADVVVFATPSFAMRETARMVKNYLNRDSILVSVSKGIERDSSLRLSQVIRQELDDRYPVAVLMGPSHAEEVARRIPTGLVSACEDRAVAERIQDLFVSERLRVYASSDVIGVELGGALKNVMALCAGCCAGMGYGDNTKAMLMTRGLTEIARLGVAMGGKRETFAGLAGMGDLIVTCTSLNSRNNRAGILVGQGMPVQEALKSIGAVVEGYYAIESARVLARKVSVEMPITEAAYEVFYQGRSTQIVGQELMLRDRRSEHESEESWV